MKIGTMNSLLKYCTAITLTSALFSGPASACNLQSASETTVKVRAQLSNFIPSKYVAAGSMICIWEIPQIDTSNCNITRTTITGDGVKPNSTVTITRNSDAAVASMRTLSVDNDQWIWEGNNLNCSVNGCGTSSYTIQTDEQVRPLACNQTVTLTLRTN